MDTGIAVNTPKMPLATRQNVGHATMAKMLRVTPWHFKAKNIN
jgi:hypothetical protein